MCARQNQQRITAVVALGNGTSGRTLRAAENVFPALELHPLRNIQVYKIYTQGEWNPG